MLKSVLVATAAVAIGGSSIVYAQQHFGGPGGYGDGGPRFEHHHRFTIQDRKAFADARIAALKAGLQLTPEQDKNWPAFEQALRDLVKLRLDRVEAREQREASGAQPPTDPFTRLQRGADRLSQTGAALKHLADAGAPLYQSLTDAQKERFKILARMLRPHHHRFAEFRGWREGRGYGEQDRGPDGLFQHRGDWRHRMIGPDRDSMTPAMPGHDRDADADSL
jgi:zinc resistance-associated protein